MAIYPKIQSPCPYRANLTAIMEGDMCRMCKRQVVDLSGYDDDARVAFLAACAGEEVCVSYRFPLRRAAGAAVIALAAAAAPMAAAAQDVDDVEFIIVGGITDPTNVEFVQDAEDAAIPELPVVYEDDGGRAAPPAATEPARPTEAEPASLPVKSPVAP